MLLHGKQLRDGSVSPGKLAPSFVADLLRAASAVSWLVDKNAGGQKLTNLGAPVALTDAARLQEVLAAIAAIPPVPVSSVFGRIGDIVAAVGDYAASQVHNDSSVSGTTVKAALEALQAAIAASVTGVSSVYGRTGAVAAAAGDYAASLVNNDSSVSGATVKAALETLSAAIAAVTGSVSSVFGRTGAIVATAGDYAASLVNNDSSVSGATVKAALETLSAAIAGATGAVSSVFGRTGVVVATAGDYAASKITNDSTVSGATTKDALNSLKASIAALVTGVSTVFGRSGAVVAAAGDYVASQITNDSSVTGSTSKDAFNTLKSSIAALVTGVSSVFGRTGAVVAAAGDYVASQVTNDSAVSGATVKDALQTLLAGSLGVYQTVVDVNLTTDANFTFANGTQTWHGLTWTGVNIAGNTDQFAVVNGTGLVLDTNANNVDRYLAVDTAPYIYLPFTQIPGFKHGASRVRLWTQGFTTGADQNFETGMNGIQTTPYASNARYGWTGMRNDSSNSFEVLAGSVAPTTPTGLGSTFTAHCIEMLGLDEVRFWLKVPTQLAGASNGAEFDLSTFTLHSIWKASNPGQQGTVWKPGDIFAAAAANLSAFIGLKTVNTFNSVKFTVTRLRIEYVNP